ncbi:hypothetical protein ACWED2_29615 [Amycolatopsis sp. NPDC005003]
MLTEDAHRRMTESLWLVGHRYERNAFPVRAHWDGVAHRRHWVLQRNFAWEWRAALAVKPLFAAESRVGAMPDDERSLLLAGYDLYCRRGARLKWLLDLFDEAAPRILAVLVLIAFAVVPFPSGTRETWGA